MAKYRVDVEGKNFLISVDGMMAKHGFFTSRFVEANDTATAENAAVEMIRQYQNLREIVQNTREDPPTIQVEQIAALDSFDGVESLEPGLVWYEENPKRWWQFWK